MVFQKPPRLLFFGQRRGHFTVISYRRPSIWFLWLIRQLKPKNYFYGRGGGFSGRGFFLHGPNWRFGLGLICPARRAPSRSHSHAKIPAAFIFQSRQDFRLCRPWRVNRINWRRAPAICKNYEPFNFGGGGGYGPAWLKIDRDISN